MENFHFKNLKFLFFKIFAKKILGNYKNFNFFHKLKLKKKIIINFWKILKYLNFRKKKNEKFGRIDKT